MALFVPATEATARSEARLVRVPESMRECYPEVTAELINPLPPIYPERARSVNFPTKKLEEVVLSNRLVHNGHPVMRWMAGNVSLEMDAADNWKPSKKKSRERIDGIVALIMGLEAASKHTPGCSYFFITSDGIRL